MIKNYSRGFINLIALILIVFLIGGAGVFLFKNKKTENKKTDNWLTYENTTYHYQIRYHPQFHAQGKNEPPYPPPPTGMSFSRRWENNEWCDFGIMASTDADGFKGEIDNIRQQGSEVESQATIAGVSTIVFDAQGGDAINRSYYLTRDGAHFRFGYNYRPAAKYSQECADVVIKMVSSFKFL